MVGFDPNLREQLSTLEIGCAGAISGVITRAALQPLDVVKVRFQLQVEPISKKSSHAKYHGVAQAAGSIYREEGVAALWKGHVPAQLLSFVYGGIQFLSFEFLTQQTYQLVPLSRGSDKLVLVHFLCGGASGSVATVFAYPFDTIRTRLIAQGEPRLYTSVTHAVQEIASREGARAFYRGLSPSLLQIAPHTGAQFAFYEVVSDMWEKWFNDDAGDGVEPSSVVASSIRKKTKTVIGSLVCGSLAGIFAKTMIYPLDLAKKRMQMQGFEAARKGFGKAFLCQGLLECLWFTVQHEGVLGLYKGLWPGMLKAAAATALHFTVYEQGCAALVNLRR